MNGLDLRRYARAGWRQGPSEVFATEEEAAERWLAENDPEGVAFIYEVQA
jgi:hypothetical protein